MTCKIGCNCTPLSVWSCNLWHFAITGARQSCFPITVVFAPGCVFELRLCLCLSPSTVVSVKSVKSVSSRGESDRRVSVKVGNNTTGCWSPAAKYSAVSSTHQLSTEHPGPNHNLVYCSLLQFRDVQHISICNIIQKIEAQC